MRGWLSNLVRREIRAIRQVLSADVDPSVRPLPSIPTIPLREVKPNPDNPIVRSLEGYGPSLRVLTRQGIIIAGNHTYLAAKQLGWKTLKAKDIDTGREYEIEL